MANSKKDVPVLRNPIVYVQNKYGETRKAFRSAVVALPGYEEMTEAEVKEAGLPAIYEDKSGKAVTPVAPTGEGEVNNG